VAEKLKAGDRVSLEDVRGTHHGTVQEILVNGLVTVRWDSGMIERCQPEELEKQPF
jgi:hypothetical protein